MSNRYVGLIRTKKPVTADYARLLTRDVSAALNAGDTFEARLVTGDMSDVDWRWNRRGAPHPSNAVTVLCVELHGRLIAGTRGPATNLPRSETFLNWIGHWDVDEDNYRSPPDFTEENLFDVDQCWVSTDRELVYHYTTWETASSILAYPVDSHSY